MTELSDYKEHILKPEREAAAATLKACRNRIAELETALVGAVELIKRYHGSAVEMVNNTVEALEFLLPMITDVETHDYIEAALPALRAKQVELNGIKYPEPVDGR